MSNDKLAQALRRAIETLEELQGCCTDHGDGAVEAITIWCPEVIEECRAALAEHEAQAAPIPKNDDPNGWVCFWLESALRCPNFVWDADQRECAEGALREALAAPQPQAEQASAPEAEEAAQSVALMVTEWVDSGIKMGTDWRSGLVAVIAKRLARFASPQAPKKPKLPRPVAWRHTLGRTNVSLTKEYAHPFGVRGVHYDPSFSVKSEPLYTEAQVRRLLQAHGIGTK